MRSTVESPNLDSLDLRCLAAHTGLCEADTADLLRTFFQTAPPLLEQTRTAIASGDWAAAARHLHTVAGGAKMVGLVRVGDAAKAVEIACRAAIEHADLATKNQVMDAVAKVSAAVATLASQFCNQ